MPDNFLSQEEIDALLGGKNDASPSAGEEMIAPDQYLSSDAAAGEEPQSLEFILDFPLHLSVRLGEVKKTLEEVRQIGPGTVVELDRIISDPVDIYVNGKLIARGDVIVVEENFGIRITNIFTPLDRVKKLK